MKLRIKGNSLRLRVSRSEVARLLDGERLEETIHFAPQDTAKLTYALEQELSGVAVTVRYTNGDITVRIPAERVNRWCLTDQIGIIESISLGSTESLDLLIEKDFACLDRSDQDNADTFANPAAGAAC
jgi:hypothetical protein